MGQRPDDVDPLDVSDRAARPVPPDEPVPRAPEVDDVAATRAHIEETRGQLGETIDAIQEKLSPHQLAQHAKDAVHDATVGKVQEAASSVADTAVGAATGSVTTAKQAGSAVTTAITRNPVPVALIGIGLGWLFIRARDGASGHAGDRYADTDPAPRMAAGSMSDAGGQDRQAARDAVGQVQDTATQTARQVQTTVGQIAGQAQNQMSEVSGHAQHGVRRAASGFQSVLWDNPLAVGAAAVALGVAAGLAIPSTGKEDELMGEARDSLVEKAHRGVQDTMEKAQTVAHEALQTAQEGAKREGLTG